MLLTIVLTFIGAAAYCRRQLHMNVVVLSFRKCFRAAAQGSPSFWPSSGRSRPWPLFMIVYGEKLVAATWYNTIADFPSPSRSG